jgi:hypothetical protein
MDVTSIALAGVMDGSTVLLFSPGVSLADELDTVHVGWANLAAAARLRPSAPV